MASSMFSLASAVPSASCSMQDNLKSKLKLGTSSQCAFFMKDSVKAKSNALKADTNELKLNIGVGAYRTEVENLMLETVFGFMGFERSLLAFAMPPLMSIQYTFLRQN